MAMFLLVSMAFYILTARATDTGDILKRLSDLESRERLYEERIRDLEDQVAFKCTVINEIDQSLPAFEDNLKKDSSKGKRFLVDPEVGVAFHVVLSQGKEYAHYGAQQPIVFDQILLNIGDGYGGSHGIFTAPFDGVYVFSASILSFVDPHPQFDAAIAKNGSPLGKIYGHGDNGKHDQGSVTLTMQLMSGDEVTVEMLSSDSSIWGNSYTSFSGFLLMTV